MSTGATTFGHVDTAEAVPRARLLKRLTGSEQLCVVHAEGGSGKTVLLSQWASDAGEPVLWLDLRSHLPSRAGFWLRVLTRLHADGWIDDATLSREVVAISESSASIDSTIQRMFRGDTTPRALIIDGLPEHSDTWQSVVDDLVTLLQRRPDMRCLVACSSVAIRDGLLADAPPISWVELTTTDLALSPREAREILERDAPRIDADRREVILSSDAAQRVDSLRFASAHHTASGLADSLALSPAIMERFTDSGLREFAGVTALAPEIDAGLAEQLTGRSDAAEVLDSFARQGAGSWIPHESGQAIFRYRDGVRQAASADFLARHPRLVFAAKRKIARWLATRIRDYANALVYALEGRDYDHASRLMLRAWPFNHEDGPRLRHLVKTLPIAQIHRRPLLALWYGLLLNEDPATQSRAAPFFVSAAAMGRVRSRSLSPAERAVLRGFESLTWRLIGHSGRMAESARQCIVLVETAIEDPEFDASLAEIIGTVFNQACISLYAAGVVDEARDAFAALVALADRLAMRHRRNLGLAGMAFVDAATGSVGDAARTLDRVREGDWPEPWVTGYAGSLGRLARAWISLSTDSPESVLAELDVLDPHVDTIEHWDLIAIARALADSRLGHARSAAHTFTRTVRSRLTRTSLPIVRDRVSGADAVLRILNGRSPSPASGNAGRTHRSMVLAMQAISAGANDDSAAASALLRKAESAALTPQQEMLAVVAGALCASRLSWDDDLRHFAGRMVDLAVDPGIRWPVILLPEADRTRLVDALEADGAHGLSTTARAIFGAICPVATDSTWHALARPTLTPRETAVLQALFAHESRTDVADALFVSVNTVKSQLRSLYTKLGVSTREQALARAVALGIAGPGDAEQDEAP